jgi:NTP pyrophosphatase (non-canonical NTP hydrolase)
MKEDQEKQILNRAVTFFGDESQKIMAIEEMSELIKELTKELRSRGDVEHIAEEIADVEIMLSQLKIIYNVHDKVASVRDYKLNRISKIMDELEKKS